MTELIPTADLRRADLPDPDDWRAMTTFAYTFDGYARFGDVQDLGAVANPIAAAWRAGESLPTDVDQLRGALFYEERRERFVDFDISGLSEPDENGVRTIEFSYDPPTPDRIEQQTYKAALVRRIGELLPA